MQADAMKNALRKRKAGGIDVSILINGEDALESKSGAEEEVKTPEEKELDLPPKGANIEKEGEEEEVPAVGTPAPDELEMIAEMLGAKEQRGGLTNKIAEYWQRMKGK